MAKLWQIYVIEARPKQSEFRRRNSVKITGFPCHRVRVDSALIVHEFDYEALLVTMLA